jgi:hypothetical protein
MKVKKTYNYRVYGINVQSEIVLPELVINNHKEYACADVVISYGLMSKEIDHEIQEYKWFNFQKYEMWFLVSDIAKYYIHNGNTIIVEPYDNANSHDVKAFLLGSAFGMLLIQRNIIAIHGGTIVIDGKAIVITGEQGAGKSTLTAALREKGYFFMADDVSVIGRRKDIKYVIHPGYPQQKLCRDAMEKMGYNVEAFRRIDEGRDKYAIPVHESFINEPMPIGAFFEISIGEGPHLEIEEITGTKKIKLLLKNIYRVEVIQYSGMSPDYFKNSIDIAKTVPFFKIKRPKDKFSIEEQISVIEKVLENKYKEFLKTM